MWIIKHEHLRPQRIPTQGNTTLARFWGLLARITKGCYMLFIRRVIKETTTPTLHVHYIINISCRCIISCQWRYMNKLKIYPQSSFGNPSRIRNVLISLYHAYGNCFKHISPCWVWIHVLVCLFISMNPRGCHTYIDMGTGRTRHRGNPDPNPPPGHGSTRRIWWVSPI